MKHVLNTLESYEALYIDAILIFSMITFILLFKSIYKPKLFQKTINNIKKLSITQIVIVVLIAFFSILTSISIYELDKKHNNPFINHTTTKITSMILLLLVSVFYFKEEYSSKKFIGTIFAIIGVYLLIS